MKKVNLLFIPVFFFFLLTVTALLSCKKSASGGNGSIPGKWLGKITSHDAPSNHTNVFTVMFAQSGTNLTGSFKDVDNLTTTISGTLTGTVNGSGIVFTLGPGDNVNGPLVATGTVNAAVNSMNGTFVSSGTNGTYGTWSLNKQ